MFRPPRNHHELFNPRSDKPIKNKAVKTIGGGFDKDKISKF